MLADLPDSWHSADIFEAHGSARRPVAWTVLGVAAWVEGFSRFYLLKHWTTDVIGGWVFGPLLLAVLAALADTLSRPAQAAMPEPANPRGQTETAVR